MADFTRDCGFCPGSQLFNIVMKEIIEDVKKIIVPKGIRYIGEIDDTTKKRKWKDGYSLSNFNKPYILNKVLTGCGFTEYCISCPFPVILISPRRFLLDNKWEQHPDEVYYFRNDDETSTNFELDVDKDDVRAIKKKAEITESGKHKTLENLERIKKDLRDAYREHKSRSFKPFKILVTYDSFKHVKSALEHFYRDEKNHDLGYDNEFEKFYSVVDEFQSIFIDARFKSDTEIDLLDQLKGVDKLCYVSATPYLNKYLAMLDEFKSLPYYEFDWETEEPERVIKPVLDIKFTTRSLNEEARRVIDSYKNQKFDTRLDSKTGNLIESKEAVIYMNSVKAICQVIKTNRLHIDQVNVLCANTTENESKVRSAFNEVLKKEMEDAGKIMTKYPKVPKEYGVIGKIPVKGQPHKMFTLCTRTVYLGADFYSTNARSFIFSDSNIQCLSVDISMDLEQILGRQRLIINPWKNNATLFVKTTDKKHKLEKEDYDRELERKIGKTNSLLESYQEVAVKNRFNLAEKYLKDAKVSHYKDDYVAVSIVEKDWDTGEILWLEPKFNKLMQVSDMRAFEVQQEDYADRFTVFSAIIENGSVDHTVTEKACELAEKFLEIGDTTEKLKMLVDLEDMEGVTEKDVNAFLELIPPKFKEYYVIMGPKFIYAFSCKEADIKREWSKLKSNEGVKDQIDVEIYKIFEVGKRYTKADIKKTLKGLYNKLGYQKTAKASDLEQYFKVKGILTPDKKNGFELLEKKGGD